MDDLKRDMLLIENYTKEVKSQIVTGGPAYPVPQPIQFGQSGMTLRDYFAASALTGLLAGRTLVCPKGMDVYAEHAIESFRMSDAMLKERNK